MTFPLLGNIHLSPEDKQVGRLPLVGLDSTPRPGEPRCQDETVSELLTPSRHIRRHGSDGTFPRPPASSLQCMTVSETLLCFTTQTRASRIRTVQVMRDGRTPGHEGPGAFLLKGPKKHMGPPRLFLALPHPS